MALGCADGTVDVAFSAEVVGCDGSWSTPGISAGGVLCGGGWSLCEGHQEVAARGVGDCTALTAANMFYATGDLSNGNSDCTNDDTDGSGTNDLWGCGTDLFYPNACGPLNMALGHDWTGTAWDADDGGGLAEKTSVHKSAGNGGVMCCKSGASPPPPLMPHPTPSPPPPPAQPPPLLPPPAVAPAGFSPATFTGRMADGVWPSFDFTAAAQSSSGARHPPHPAPMPPLPPGSQPQRPYACLHARTAQLPVSMHQRSYRDGRGDAVPCSASGSCTCTYPRALAHESSVPASGSLHDL